MMKRIFSLLFVAVACSAAALAQTSLVATLKHGSISSEYYGTSALKEAYAAAAIGDVITLSGGEFEAVDIEKAITVRGAGIPLANDNPTLLLGAFNVNIPLGTSNLTIEGVQCMNMLNVYSTNNIEIGNPQIAVANFLKCYFKEDIRCANSTPFFMHCVIEGTIASLRYDMVPLGDIDHKYNTTVTCLECAINATDGHGKGGDYLAKIDVRNCFINHLNGMSSPYSNFVNCILGTPIWSQPNSDYYITNCLCYGGYEQISQATNTILETYDLSAIFKTFKGTFSSQETFELTDEAKAKYKGSDGKQVGIYGGTNPFDPTPTNPQIKKFNVSTTTTDGKLNVKINVE